MKVLFSVPLLPYIAPPPPPLMLDLGLAYLASAVKRAGHTAFLLDWGMPHGEEHYVSFLRKNRPDVVGIKVFTKDLFAAQKTIDLIKSVNKDITVIVGGPHPSVVPPEELMNDLAGVDFAFRGEADEGLPLLLEHIAAPDNDTDISSISGLVWRDGEGKVRVNSRKFIKDIDEISQLPYDLIDLAKYPFNNKKMIATLKGISVPFLTSRGCPGRCTFCCVKLINGRRVRFRSMEKITAEIKKLYNEQKVRYLLITDNGFSTDIKFVEEFCKMLIREKLNVGWNCVVVNIKDFLNPELAGLMKKSGCGSIIVGFESGSPRIRELIKKPETNDEIRQLVDIFLKQGIDTSGYFMFGFPTETRDDVQQSIDLSMSLKLNTVDFNICYPLPGTEVYEYIKKKYKFSAIDWKTFNPYDSPYPAGEISTIELKSIAKRASNLYMLRNDPLAIGKRLVKRIFNRKAYLPKIGF